MGGIQMGGWKSKFAFLLIIYFAGYSTAVYTLNPAPEKGKCSLEKNHLSSSSMPETSQSLHKFNEGLCKCIKFLKEVTKDAALQLGQYVKQKLEERQHQSDRKSASLKSLTSTKFLIVDVC
jgi:hypothetical protein